MRTVQVTTTAQQIKAARAARKAGGYDELIRLEVERRAAGGRGGVVRDSETGRFSWRADATPDARSASREPE